MTTGLYVEVITGPNGKPAAEGTLIDVFRYGTSTRHPIFADKDRLAQLTNPAPVGPNGNFVFFAEVELLELGRNGVRLPAVPTPWTVIAGEPSGLVDDPWHDAALVNGWANAGAPYSNVGYRLSSDGRSVLLRGAWNPPGAGQSSPLTFPAGYRPLSSKVVSAPRSAAGGDICDPIKVATTGVVTVTVSFDSGFGSLDGLAFDLDA